MTLRRDAAPATTEANVQAPTNRPQCTEPIPLSESLHRVALDLLYRELADQVEADVLDHLAAVKRSTALAARRRLTDEGIEVLVDIIANRHSVPTIGFWRRYAAS